MNIGRSYLGHSNVFLRAYIWLTDFLRRDLPHGLQAIVRLTDPPIIPSNSPASFLFGHFLTFYIHLSPCLLFYSLADILVHTPFAAHMNSVSI